MTALERGAITWRKSSYSNGEAACVEVGWRKSSYSNGASACVEVASVPIGVAVRDSKNPSGPTLAFNHTPWRALLIRCDQYPG